jgi:FkbM family methyltransferase
MPEFYSKTRRLIIRNDLAYSITALLKHVYYYLNLRRKSFSQYGEDLIISTLLPENFGTYIDIGAGRPIDGSNTYALYKRGYSGILVEPISLNQKLARVFRARDKRISVLCGATSEEFDFYEMYPYEYSTTSMDVMSELLRHGKAQLRTTRKLQMLPARTFAVEMSPLDPTLVCIDAEGCDFEILSSLDWAVTLPRVVCVESLIEGSSDMAQLLLSKGYRYYCRAGLSEIYIHSAYLPH